MKDIKDINDIITLLLNSCNHLPNKGLLTKIETHIAALDLANLFKEFASEGRYEEAMNIDAKTWNTVISELNDKIEQEEVAEIINIFREKASSSIKCDNKMRIDDIVLMFIAQNMYRYSSIRSALSKCVYVLGKETFKALEQYNINNILNK
jgi:hypothetical protein